MLTVPSAEQFSFAIEQLLLEIAQAGGGQTPVFERGIVIFSGLRRWRVAEEKMRPGGAAKTYNK
jgi:hypothetical protein